MALRRVAGSVTRRVLGAGSRPPSVAARVVSGDRAGVLGSGASGFGASRGSPGSACAIASARFWSFGGSGSKDGDDAGEETATAPNPEGAPEATGERDGAGPRPPEPRKGSSPGATTPPAPGGDRATNDAGAPPSAATRRGTSRGRSRTGRSDAPAGPAPAESAASSDEDVPRARPRALPRGRRRKSSGRERTGMIRGGGENEP